MTENIIRITVKNPWHTERDLYSTPFFEVDKPIYKYKEGAIYKQGEKCYLYTYKGFAFSQRAGIDKELLNMIVDQSKIFVSPERPSPYDESIDWEYCRKWACLMKQGVEYTGKTGK